MVLSPISQIFWRRYEGVLRLGRCHSISSFGFVLLNQGKLEHILRGCHKNVTGCVREALIRLQNLTPHS